jgi:hypothetical protein
MLSGLRWLFYPSLQDFELSVEMLKEMGILHQNQDPVVV